MNDPAYQLDPAHPANRDRVSKYPSESERADRHRDEALDKSSIIDGVRQGKLRDDLESHGPQLPEPEPTAGRPTWAGTMPDLVALADEDESGDLVPGILAPRRGVTAARLREMTTDSSGR
jgi:hypothetical protein